MKPDFTKIPTDPGAYLYYNKQGEIIYIGKAKNLRNRVRSYWSKSAELSPAKQQMVEEINTVDYIVVNNETEALLLEAGLIKKHLPKYNIVLRDDKNWTYIVITKEAFPKIVTVRGNKKIKGEYFGPYTNARSAKTLVRLIHKILPLRTCSRDLSKLPNGLVCMQYHLGNCLGPCEKIVTENTYLSLINQAKDILRGKTDALKKELEQDMKAASEKHHYEKAAVFRNKLESLSVIRQRQDVVHPFAADQDIVGIASEKNTAVITIMQLRKGQLLDTRHYTVSNTLFESNTDILEQFLLQYYGTLLQKPKEVLLPEKISFIGEQAFLPITISYPQRGSKKRMLGLAQKNAWLHYHRYTKTKPSPDSLYSIKDALNLEKLPVRIEAYDISNIHGEFAVGAMVVAINGQPAKSEYRQFKIKTVSGSNDVAMMKEVLERRQKHPEWGEPSLILLDGGKPQLNTVYPSLPPKWKERVVALAKKHEEIFVPGRKNPILLQKGDPGLLLLRRLRDEVHRRAITHYRSRHRKSTGTKRR